eukprot:TRINITY_DN14726_c0_g1_i1.p1 TRINITY_DN14726_c0_g1~~TRINITY_DN14726_c0_g1_i1.p1  ORF type:complete len:513 (-),score=95.56 TRINITY_DN14726_c0_g1_i1:42-1580(-)
MRLNLSRNLRDSVSALSNKSVFDNFKDENAYQHTLNNTAIHLLVEHSTTWHLIHIPTDQLECALNLKFLIRKGIPDTYRPRIWKIVTGEPSFSMENPSFYQNAMNHAFGPRIPTQIGKIPEFGGHFRPENHYLTAEGVSRAKRILSVIALENPDLEYWPFVHDLVCILLHFMSESDTYELIHLIKNAGTKYFSTNRKDIFRFFKAFDDIVREREVKVANHMKTLNTNTHNFADDWFCRLFVGIFPYQTVLRIFDAFITEGAKIGYRVALAFLKLNRDELLKTKTADEFHQCLKSKAKQWVDTDALMNKAFGLRMKRKHMKKFIERHRVITVPDQAISSYYRPKIRQESALVTELQFEILWSWLPQRFVIRDPNLVFNTARDGFSLKRLFHAVGELHPTFLFAKTDRGEVFGAFVSHAWKKSKHFYGDRNCFLFRFTPHPEMFGWDEGSTDYFQFAAEGDLQVGGGGGVGFALDDELNKGRTQRCTSFDNEPLTSDGRELFNCVAVEVYSLAS